MLYLSVEDFLMSKDSIDIMTWQHMKSLKASDEYKGLLCLPVKDGFLNLYW